ncbi:hypothetical protein [Streptomyces sp. NPDC005302]|uniref:hypothetical protein n=1 Tax=Streptomyces sp. NPDC005302 TaxID=3154675 RepID=UPI0033BB05DD
MKPARSNSGVSHRSCDRCGSPVLRQREGLPWVVVVDDVRHTPGQAAELTTPNRLAWCLRESKWTGARLVEVHTAFHNRECPRPHLVEHTCPPGTPLSAKPEGTLW